MLSVLVVLGLLSVPGCGKDDGTSPAQTVVSSVDTVVLIDTVVIIVDTIAVPPNSVVDPDGNAYPTTEIGSQRWMAENLRTNRYANGDFIAYVPDNAQWANQTSGAWANYDCDAAYDGQYGKLYNWYTVTDPRGVCPAGWHVPTDADWMELEQTLGVPASDLDNTGPRGGAANAGGQLKAGVLWNSPNQGANDSTGFSALPGGDRSDAGSFGLIGMKGYWWSITAFDVDLSWLRSLSCDNAGIYRLSTYKDVGNSVRCVED
jgi:uncharacterized protein (TIGR02145 family)